MQIWALLTFDKNWHFTLIKKSKACEKEMVKTKQVTCKKKKRTFVVADPERDNVLPDAIYLIKLS